MPDIFDKRVSKSRRLLFELGLLRFLWFKRVEEPFYLQELWALADMV